MEPTSAELTVHATLDDVDGLDDDASRAQTRWLVVEDCGDRARPRIRTAEGVPVVCPVRDGVHALYPDGAVWRSGAGKGGSGEGGSGKGRSGESGTMGA